MTKSLKEARRTDLTYPKFPEIFHQGFKDLVDFHGAKGEADIEGCKSTKVSEKSAQAPLQGTKGGQG